MYRQQILTMSEKNVINHTDDLLKLDNQICFPFYVVSRLIIQQYQPLLHQLDITYPQYLVLLSLWEKDNVTVSDLCRQLFLASNTITPLLKRLEHKGFIKRIRSQEDERKVFIALTKKGSQLKANALCIPQQILTTFHMDDDSASKASLLKTALQDIIQHLSPTE
jgi:DNA-binding MarR family transcriptional regulator